MPARRPRAVVSASGAGGHRGFVATHYPSIALLAGLVCGPYAGASAVDRDPALAGAAGGWYLPWAPLLWLAHANRLSDARAALATALADVALALVVLWIAAADLEAGRSFGPANPAIRVADAGFARLHRVYPWALPAASLLLAASAAAAWFAWDRSLGPHLGPFYPPAAPLAWQRAREGVREPAAATAIVAALFGCVATVVGMARDVANGRSFGVLNVVLVPLWFVMDFVQMLSGRPGLSTYESGSHGRRGGRRPPDA